MTVFETHGHIKGTTVGDDWEEKVSASLKNAQKGTQGLAAEISLNPSRNSETQGPPYTLIKRLDCRIGTRK